MPPAPALLSLFYQALASKYGIALAVSDISQAKAKLYKARAESGDSDLSQISIHQSPSLPESELWLVKRPQKVVLNQEEANVEAGD